MPSRPLEMRLSAMKAWSTAENDVQQPPAAQVSWMESLLSGPRRTPRLARISKLARPYAQARTGSWHVLRERRFRGYFIGCTISNLGTWLQNTAQMLLAFELTHNVFYVAIITSAQFSGFLTIGPWAGSLADRMGRKNVLIGTQLLSMVVTGALALLELRGRLTEAELVIAAMGTGLALTFALPVQTAMVSALVPERDKKAALAMNSVSYNAGRTLAPLFCLFVLASIGTGWAFALNSLSFGVFTLIIVAVYPNNGIARQQRIQHRAVLSIAFQRPRIMLLLAMVAAVTFADDPVLVLGPSLADQLKVPTFWPAYFLAALGIGTVLGAMFPTRPVKTSRAAVPLVVLSISVVVFAMGIRPWISLLAAVLAGMAGLLTGAASQALLLKKASPENAVQVMALWAVAWAGTKPIASLADGLLASHLGIQLAAIFLALPAFSIGIAESCLGKKQKARLKKRMSEWNGTQQLAATQSAT
jgi:MFS family permease